jgi:capsular polysaccharide transport system permease protein
MIVEQKERDSGGDAKLDEAFVELRPKSKPWRVDRLFRNTSIATRARSSEGKVIDVEPTALDDDGTAEPKTMTGGRMPFALISFIGLVILPFIASAIYFAFIASDQYVAETRFAVRSLAQSSKEDTEDAGILSMTSMPQDGYIVTSFIHSTEILNRLAGQIDYRSMFTGGQIDFLSRFNPKESNEAFLKYWDNQVTTYVDGPSGIITLQTRTFSPQNSQDLASIIVTESEKLINELSLRAQNDMTTRFTKEVERATESYRAALAALNNFQNTAGLLTPEARATETGTLLTGLLQNKLQLESRLFVLRESRAESSPAYQQLLLASKNLENQIGKLQQELAGNSGTDKNIASSIQTFSRLETDRRLAESLYEISRKNLDAAQTEATRKGLYLVVFVPPTVPQESLYPHRFSTPILLLIALGVAWLALALLWASIEDHKL